MAKTYYYGLELFGAEQPLLNVFETYGGLQAWFSAPSIHGARIPIDDQAVMINGNKAYYYDHNEGWIPVRMKKRRLNKKY